MMNHINYVNKVSLCDICVSHGSSFWPIECLMQGLFGFFQVPDVSGDVIESSIGVRSGSGP